MESPTWLLLIRIHLPYLLLLLLLLLLSPDRGKADDPHHHHHHDHDHQVDSYESVVDALKSELKHSITGPVYLKGEPAYHLYRIVPNGGCNHILPALIVRPRDTYEVSTVVKIARRFNFPISVRSGGHGYQCTGIQEETLNIDMRELRKVRVLSPHEAEFGAGNRFRDLFRVINPEHYTFIHGQCEMVGVSGFLLGLGSNVIGTSSRFGAGADQVLEYTLVLADGTIAKVNHDNTTLFDDYHKVREVIPHDYDNDLKFALRTSGASYAIATEFKYIIHPRPETLPMMIPIYIENSYDLKRVQRASEQGRFGIMLGELYFFRRPQLTNLIGQVMNIMPRILKALSGNKVEPIVAIMMDLKAPGRKGNLQSAVNFLKYHGIKLGMEDVGLMSTLGLGAIDLTVSDQTDYYLTEEEREREGFASIAAASMNHLESTAPIEKVFFTHPVLGLKHKHSSRGPRTGCDFCNWFIYFGNPEVPIQPITGKTTGLIASEIDCSYNKRKKRAANSCENFIRKVKHTLTVDAYKVGARPSQYVNTPSCDDIGDHFSKRYWGDNYDRLLKIKDYWDPDNVFNYCQSVGSTSESCCPLP